MDLISWAVVETVHFGISVSIARGTVAPSEKKAKLVDTGVPSEDEIRSLLHHKKRMLLADIAAEFKKRLKNAEDRKTFTRRVGAVAMLDPGESGKKRHLILKPE